MKAIICAKLQRYKEEFLAAKQIYVLTSATGLPMFAFKLFFVEYDHVDSIFYCLGINTWLRGRFEEGLAFARKHIQQDPNNAFLRFQEAKYLELLVIR